MHVVLTIDKFYAYEPMQGTPEPKELASGEAAKLGPNLFGRRVVRECPGGLNDRGAPAQLVTELRGDFFDALEEADRRIPARRAAFLGRHFEERVLSWNAPPGAVIAVSVDGDADLETALRAYLGVVEG